MKSSNKSILSLLGVVALTACGGGGGGGDTAPPPPPPPPTTFTVGGTVSGLQGSGLTLQNSAGDDLTVAADGSFTFATAVTQGTAYNVTVFTQPTSPEQTCDVTNGSGTANANVSNVTVTCTTNAAATDTDGDGLSDDEELAVYGTSPLIADTDGDGESDFREIVELGFDAGVNPYRYNPRVADLPRVKVDVQTTPIIGAIFEDSNSVSRDIATTRSQSQTNSTSSTLGGSVTLGVEASVTGAVSPFEPASATLTTSVETTVSYDQTNTQENSTAWEEMRSSGVEESTNYTGGYVRVGVVISNEGHIPFTLEQVSLSAVQAGSGNADFVPFGVLDFDSQQGFPSTSLSGGQSTGDLVFDKSDLDLGTLRTMLTASRSITVAPALFELTDANGQPFAFQEAEVASRTAKILIDYGPFAPTELYRVATNIDPSAAGQTLAQILTEALLIDFSEDGNGFTSLRSVSTGDGRWIVTLRRDTGAGFVLDTRDPEVVPYSAASIDVRAGDEVLIVYVEDADGDGIGLREEFLNGTSPSSADTDGDGLSDFVELREPWTVTAVNEIDPNRYPAEVYSSPVSADYDDDGLSDAEERDRGQDPFNPDTDGDGINDFLDIDLGNQPLVSTLLLTLGEQSGGLGTDRAVTVNGAISARFPQQVTNVSIDWESDGTVDLVFDAQATSININSQPHDYISPGTYTVTVMASDDATPANTLRQTARVVITEPERAIEDFGWDAGWRRSRHLRQLVDLNQDGFEDLIASGDVSTLVSLGSPSGLLPPTQWSEGDWGTNRYEGVFTDPRRFADVDSDGDLDIVGLDASAGLIRYGLNAGDSFDDAVDWTGGINWVPGQHAIHVVDVDANGFADVIHRTQNGITVYTSSGSSLELSSPIVNVSAWPGDSGALSESDTPTMAADLDGDGCTDIVLFGVDGTYFNRSQCNGEYGDWQVITSTFGQDGGWDVDIHERFVADVNGDGLPDLVGMANVLVAVYLNETNAPGAIQFQTSRQDWSTTGFSVAQGWRNVQQEVEQIQVSGQTFDVTVRAYAFTRRYLADANSDGFMDIMGFNNSGAVVGLNSLGLDGEARFADPTITSSAFAPPAWSAATITGTALTDGWGYSDIADPLRTQCEPPNVGPVTLPINGICVEYFPRLVGDINGDGRADLVRMDRTGTIVQETPYVTPFVMQ